jgi:hypothetical protein
MSLIEIVLILGFLSITAICIMIMLKVALEK